MSDVSHVTLSASRWQMHQVPRFLLQKLTFAVTKFDDALCGGNVALLAPPHLVQGVLVFCVARDSSVEDVVCNEEKMSLAKSKQQDDKLCCEHYIPDPLSGAGQYMWLPAADAK